VQYDYRTQQLSLNSIVYASAPTNILTQQGTGAQGTTLEANAAAVYASATATASANTESQMNEKVCYIYCFCSSTI